MGLKYTGSRGNRFNLCKKYAHGQSELRRRFTPPILKYNIIVIHLAHHYAKTGANL
jgi:hypothetical protein